MALNLIQTNAFEVTPVLTINNQTGTSYTFALSDSVNTLVTTSNSSAVAVTIPLNSSVPFPVGSVLNIVQTGTGQITVSGAAGVTVVSTSAATPTTPKTRARYGVLSLIETSENNWLVLGDIV
jgi:hypothetical protein